MVRVGSLYDQSLVLKEERDNKTNMTSDEQIDAVLACAKNMDRIKDEIAKKYLNIIS